MLEFIPVALLPILIFFIRVTDMSLDTMRVLFVVRGRRAQAWVVGFLQSALWVIAVASVLSHLDNLLNVLAYAAGFATGNVVGMRIEERLAIGHSHLRVISPQRGEAVAAAVRAAGYAVTELSGRGKDGTVSILTTSVRRRDIDPVRSEVLQADPDAFMTLSDVRPLHRGFWRA
ncbi:MAG: DUF5698 domain-containing protein [Chloroflexi bacterium]|nr:DUF5698 domain-containing protein [Chloroflexota bacterium]